MRFTATVLATVLALVVISGMEPALSGMMALPPCETAPLVSPTPIPKPKAPTNLRVVPTLDDLLDLFVSGPHAGADSDYYDADYYEAVAAADDPHAYYFALASRSDCFAAYSLRMDAQVVKYAYPTGGPRDLAYLYPSDPDPRRQDAMKILSRADQAGPYESLRVPLGAHHPKNLFIVEERWWGAEMKYENTHIGYYKGDPYFESGAASQWIAVRTQIADATQATHTLPPGGPYVLMLNPQSANSSNVKAPFFRDGNPSFPRLRVPYTKPYSDQRGYSEGVGPRDTSASSAGAEFGVVAERWTRIWHFFERAADQDWSSTEEPAGPRTAYRWTMWAADATRGPVRIIDGAVVSIYPGSSGFSHWRMHMGIGAAYSEIPAGRGPLVAYARNIVALHGISKASAMALLAKPVM